MTLSIAPGPFKNLNSVCFVPSATNPPNSLHLLQKTKLSQKIKALARLLLYHKDSTTTLISFLLKRRPTFPQSRSSFFLRSLPTPNAGSLSPSHTPFAAQSFFCCLHSASKPDILRVLWPSAPCPPIKTPQPTLPNPARGFGFTPRVPFPAPACRPRDSSSPRLPYFTKPCDTMSLR